MAPGEPQASARGLSSTHPRADAWGSPGFPSSPRREVVMSGVRSRVGAAVVVGLAAALVAVPAGRAQDRVTAPNRTQFPEPTQFDVKPFAAKLDDDALAVAYSPDGSLAAVGCADKTVRLFE